MSSSENSLGEKKSAVCVRTNGDFSWVSRVVAVELAEKLSDLRVALVELGRRKKSMNILRCVRVQSVSLIGVGWIKENSLIRELP